MFLQRPSSAKSQDVQHILAKTFRQLFTRDAIAPDTVHFLNKSKGGDDAYHEQYVEALQKGSDGIRMSTCARRRETSGGLRMTATSSSTGNLQRALQVSGRATRP